MSKITISTIQSRDFKRDATDKDWGSSPKIIALFFLTIEICFLLFVSFQLLGLSIGKYSLLVWWFFP